MPSLKEIPHALEWLNEPTTYTLEPLSMTANAKTDWFVSPQGDMTKVNAPALLFNVNQDFTLSARVSVGFKSAFDAAVLAFYQNEASWAKLCFEVSPDGDPMLVSVVTKGTSDDCNSVFITANSIYLRIAKVANAFAFHHSTDNKYWHFTRTFALDKSLPLKAGFLVQAPTGEGCTADFDDISYQTKTLKDLRSGD